MNEELKETVLQVADYSSEERARLIRRMHWLFIAGLAGFTVFLVIYFMGMDSAPVYGTIAGLGLGIAFGMIIIGVIFTSRYAARIREFKMRFCNYIWGYSRNKTILYQGHATGSIPVSNGLSDRISKDLKKRGFKYAGPVTIYSHLQACGIINDHDKECPCWQKIVSVYPTVNRRRDHEVI